MSIDNHVRKALLEKRPTFGSWVQIGHPAVAEILANAGFDWLGIDCEHTDIDVGDFAQLARGMYGRSSVPFVRVRENDVLAIRQVLDIGAQGVIVPLIHNKNDAKKAVSSAKYPPSGIRGFCFSRMNEYGVQFEKYAESANDNIAVVAMIESVEAVDNIDDILSVDGIDGIFMGPYDLSGSMGIPGKLDAPEMKQAKEAVLEACGKAQKAAGIHVVLPEEKKIIETIRMGFTFVAISGAVPFLNQVARKSLDVAKTAQHKI